MRYCTVWKCILHESVHTVCVNIAQNARWYTGRLSDTIAAILPCTALCLQPKRSHILYVQYTIVSSCFFNAIFYCKRVYLTLGKVHTVCANIAQKSRWYTGVFSDVIAAILPYTAHSLQLKCSSKLYVQYTSDSICFFNAIFYCLEV